MTDTLRAALEAAKADLLKCSELFSSIRGDWTDPRTDCREGWSIIDARVKAIDEALAALSANTGAGGDAVERGAMALCKAAEDDWDDLPEKGSWSDIYERGKDDYR